MIQVTEDRRIVVPVEDLELIVLEHLHHKGILSDTDRTNFVSWNFDVEEDSVYERYSGHLVRLRSATFKEHERYGTQAV